LLLKGTPIDINNCSENLINTHLINKKETNTVHNSDKLSTEGVYIVYRRKVKILFHCRVQTWRYEFYLASALLFIVLFLLHVLLSPCYLCTKAVVYVTSASFLMSTFPVPLFVESLTANYHIILNKN